MTRHITRHEARLLDALDPAITTLVEHTETRDELLDALIDATPPTLRGRLAHDVADSVLAGEDFPTIIRELETVIAHLALFEAAVARGAL